MKMLTKQIETKLLKNYEAGSENPWPVVKFFTPDAACTWLIAEMDENGMMYGLCDLGLGSPELGYVSLQELRTVRGRLGLPVERDMWWKAEKSLEAYAAEACREGRITA